MTFASKVLQSICALRLAAFLALFATGQQAHAALAAPTAPAPASASGGGRFVGIEVVQLHTMLCRCSATQRVFMLYQEVMREDFATVCCPCLQA